MGVFVSEEEFDGSELMGLESGGIPEDAAELDVFGWGEGFEDGPLFEEHALDVFDSGKDFETGAEFVGLDVGDGGPEFVDDEFHPEFGCLVLDDEEGFVVVRGIGQGFLGGEDSFEVQVSVVIHSVGEVLLDCGFEWSGHDLEFTWGVGWFVTGFYASIFTGVRWFSGVVEEYPVCFSGILPVAKGLFVGDNLIVLEREQRKLKN